MCRRSAFDVSCYRYVEVTLISKHYAGGAGEHKGGLPERRQPRVSVQVLVVCPQTCLKR